MQSDLARLGLDLTVCQNELARVRKEIDAVQQRALLAQDAASKWPHPAARKRKPKACA